MRQFLELSLKESLCVQSFYDRKYTSFLNILYFIHFSFNIRCNVRPITHPNNDLLLPRTAIIAQRLCRTKCVGRRDQASAMRAALSHMSTTQRSRHTNRPHSSHTSWTGLMGISEKGTSNTVLNITDMWDTRSHNITMTSLTLNRE